MLGNLLVILVVVAHKHKVLSQTIDYTSNCPPSLTRDKYLVSYNDSYCFRFAPIHHSWANARLDCQKDGGDLAQITDQGIQTFLEGVMKNTLHWRGETWIGATDHAVEGKWIWVTGEPVSYGHWHSGEGPSHHGGFLFIPSAAGEDCAVIRMDTGQWHDYSCSKTFNYICQYGNTQINSTPQQMVTKDEVVTNSQLTSRINTISMVTDNPPHPVMTTLT